MADADAVAEVYGRHCERCRCLNEFIPQVEVTETCGTGVQGALADERCGSYILEEEADAAVGRGEVVKPFTGVGQSEANASLDDQVDPTPRHHPSSGEKFHFVSWCGVWSLGLVALFVFIIQVMVPWESVTSDLAPMTVMIPLGIKEYEVERCLQDHVSRLITVKSPKTHAFDSATVYQYVCLGVQVSLQLYPMVCDELLFPPRYSFSNRLSGRTQRLSLHCLC